MHLSKIETSSKLFFFFLAYSPFFFLVSGNPFTFVFGDFHFLISFHMSLQYVFISNSCFFSFTHHSAVTFQIKAFKEHRYVFGSNFRGCGYTRASAVLRFKVFFCIVSFGTAACIRLCNETKKNNYMAIAFCERCDSCRQAEGDLAVMKTAQLLRWNKRCFIAVFLSQRLFDSI